MFVHHEPDHNTNRLAKSDGLFWRKPEVDEENHDINFKLTHNASQWWA